jgi:hypothetical protein
MSDLFGRKKMKKFENCDWCLESIDEHGKCLNCGPELRSKARVIAKKIGVNVERAFELAPSFRDRDDSDFLVITIFEAIKLIAGEEFPLKETLNPLITEEVERWYDQAWLYLNPIHLR